MELAIAAAPKPLSMLTTDTPLAQLFSIAEQRREAAEARAVADAGRDGDDRHVHQPADHARQRAFHAGDDDDHAGGDEALVLGEQAVQAGDADVVEPVDRIAHDLGGDRRFLGDRQVGGAGARRRRSVPLPGGHCRGRG